MSKKHFGRVYTPDHIVNQMLQRVPDFRDIAICDPSCGDGQFLVIIAEKVCKLHQETGDENYRRTLEKLTGFDVDADALAKAGKRLQPFGFAGELRVCDAMNREDWDEYYGKFDYVIGNPPYVRVQNLEKERRDIIKSGDWITMSGNTDLYILFYEMGFDLLKTGGVLLYIAPFAWLRNNTGGKLRELIANEHNIRGIWDFGEHQVFQEADTYVCIAEIQADTMQETPIPGWKWDGDRFAAGCLRFCADGGQVLSQADAEFLDDLDKREIMLGDIADINVGIQTHADGVFVFEPGSVDVEPGILRKTYKVSTSLIEKQAIYPYKDGRLLSEEDLRSEFPKAYEYLLGFRAQLEGRDKGKFPKDKWYGYGRQFAIPYGEKLLTPNMSDAPNFKLVTEPDALFYGGYSVMLKDGGDLTELLDELNGADMERYIRLTSQPFKSGWYSYNKTYMQGYRLRSVSR